MTPEQIEALGPAFADYLRRFLFCCEYTQTFDLLNVYCRGLLSDLPRKTAEPIALASGTAVRTLQEFLKDHAWSYRHARTTLQEHVAATLPAVPADDLGTVGVVDETATVKKGTKTPGVQRQWCGERGKTENCVVTVHLAVAHRERWRVRDPHPDRRDDDRWSCLGQKPAVADPEGVKHERVYVGRERLAVNVPERRVRAQNELEGSARLRTALLVVALARKPRAPETVQCVASRPQLLGRADLCQVAQGDDQVRLFGADRLDCRR